MTTTKTLKDSGFAAKAMAPIIFAICSLSLFVGCGDPPLNPVEGTVTLGGKPYERLLVYFRPVGGKVDRFSMGVGETDKDGTLGLRSSAGDGLAAGKYRVCFNCYVAKGKAVGLGEKADDDDRTLVTEDIVPAPYNDPESSPVEFVIQRGVTNLFEYDIPISTQ